MGLEGRVVSCVGPRGLVRKREARGGGRSGRGAAGSCGVNVMLAAAKRRNN